MVRHFFRGKTVVYNYTVVQELGGIFLWMSLWLEITDVAAFSAYSIKELICWDLLG